jgi:putative transposase
MAIIRTPFRASQANGVAERFVQTVRSECLDWLLIVNQQQLDRALAVFVDHYNGHRPHRALDLAPPSAACARAQRAADVQGLCIQRRDRMGGLLHEYNLAA